MAFPAFVNSATSTSTTGSLTLTMPTGLVAGNLLIATIGAGNIASGSPSMSGWTKIFSDDQNVSSPSTLAVFAVIATTSSSGSWNTGFTVNMSAVVFQISGWGGVISGIKSASTGSSTSSLTCPNLSAGSAAAYLWLAVGMSYSGSITAAPSGFSNYTEITAGSNTYTAMASLQLNASSETPGAFTGTASNASAGTLAIPPQGGIPGIPVMHRTPIMRASLY